MRQPHRQLTAPEVEDIIVNFSNGETMASLARRYGCYRGTISAYLHAAGVSAPKKGFNDTQVREMERLYETGLSLDKVGERFGTSGTTVTKYLRGRGVRIRKRHERV